MYDNKFGGVVFGQCTQEITEAMGTSSIGYVKDRLINLIVAA